MFSWKSAFCSLNWKRIPITKEQSKWKNTYFVCWLWEDFDFLNKTPSDNDIVKKNYFVVDIDIRSELRDKKWENISQDELLKICKSILNVCDSKKDYMDYTMSVCSWNWLHIYYVWDDADLSSYKMWVSYFFERFDSDILEWFNLKTDKSCSNLSRIFRCPWSINSKPDKEWYIWDVNCDIIEIKANNKSRILWMLWTLESKYQERFKNDKIYVPKSSIEWTESLWDMIHKIPCSELFIMKTWLEIARDWKNFISDKDWNYISWFYIQEDNKMIFQDTSSRHNKHWHQTYYPFDYIKYEILENWTDEDVFKWAIDNYPDIKEQSEINKKQYKELKKKEQIENMNNIIPMIEDSENWERSKYYYYADEMFDQWFWWIKEWELTVIASDGNGWKTTFCIKMLERNLLKNKKWMMINLEFDVDDVHRYNFWRRFWIPENEIKLQWTEEDTRNSDLVLSECEKYIKKQREKILVVEWKQKICTMENIVEMVMEYHSKWYWLIVIDSFSSIGDNASDLNAQSKSMQIFHELCKSTWVCIVLIHHFNKWWNEFSWSKKIYDLSNNFIQIHTAVDWNYNKVTAFVQMKDKSKKEKSVVYWYFRNWDYEEMPSSLYPWDKTMMQHLPKWVIILRDN